MGDGLFVALARPAHWPLATPPQLAQNLPHVAVVVPNPKLLFDQMAYSPQRPQRRLVAQSLRPLQQTLLQPLQVFRTQTRLASGTAGLPKSLSSLLSQHSNPAVHAGVAHFQATGYFRLAQPLLQQSYRPQAAALQSLKISAYSLWVSHADIDASRVVLVALYYATLNSGSGWRKPPRPASSSHTWRPGAGVFRRASADAPSSGSGAVSGRSRR